MNHPLRSVAIAAAFALASIVSPCRAIIFSVSMDTTPLIGDPAGPFSLEFQLNDGNFVADGNNTASIADFNFGIGGPLGTPATVGGVSGNLGGVVVMTQTDPFGFNDFIQSFTPGSNLTFTVYLSDVAQVFPDQFAFFILDSTDTPLPTEDVFGGSFLYTDLGSGIISTFASDPLFIPPPDTALAAPFVTLIPEPSTVLLIGSGAALVAWSRRRRG